MFGPIKPGMALQEQTPTAKSSGENKHVNIGLFLRKLGNSPRGFGCIVLSGYYRKLGYIGIDSKFWDRIARHFCYFDNCRDFNAKW